MNQITGVRLKEVRNDVCHLFDLDVFLPGYKMLVNVSSSIISLLAKEQGDVISQRILTGTEIRVALPLLLSPACCPQEVLHACYDCPYEILLQALFSPHTSSLRQWDDLVLEHCQRLNVARQQRAQRDEMRGVYNALFSLRQKLSQLGLDIRSRREGYYLSALASE